MKENKFPTLIKSLYILHVALVVCGAATLWGIDAGKDLYIETLKAIGVNLGILCLGQGFAISKWSENVPQSTTSRTEKLEANSVGRSNRNPSNSNVPSEDP